KVLDAVKHQRVKERYVDSLTAFTQQYSESPHDTVVYSELIRIIETAVTQLPFQMQRVFRMSREEGLSHAEIATQLGISENTVKKTINRVLHVLRTKFLQLLIVSLLTHQISISLPENPFESHIAD